MTFIIIEGCDGVGKSTLVNELRRHFRWSHNVLVLHRGPPQVHPFIEYETALDVLYDAEPNRMVICDRWHWGELIYGPLYRGKTLLGTPGAWHIDMWLAARGGMVAVIDADHDVVRGRLQRRGETYLRDEDVPHVLESYRNLVRHRPPVPTVLTNNDDALGDVLSVATTDIRPHPSYVGPPRPKRLLVGDRRHNLTESTHRAAFVPYPGTSGRYLLQSLPAHMWSTTGLINSDPREVQDLKREWNSLGRPHCVALGVSAHHTLTSYEIPHGVVPHPQYVRRFHHLAQAEYGRLITNTGLENNLKWLK